MVFQERIVGLVSKKLNEKLNATILYDKVKLSMLSNFPNASITIHNVIVINDSEDFKNDTVAKIKKLSATINATDLLGSTIAIQKLSINKADFNIVIAENGKANYELLATKETKKKEEQEPPDTDNNKKSKLSFDIQKYSISNTNISFIDQQSNTHLYLKNCNHTGKGKLSSTATELITDTQIETVDLTINNISYLNKVAIDWNAIFDIDFITNTYTFKNNTLKINSLPINFEGHVAFNDIYDIQLKINAPNATFKSLLSLIPNAYAKDFSGVKTSGKFNLKGNINGNYSDTQWPKFDLVINSQNALFQYPKLPKSVENINISASLANRTGKKNDTFLHINKLNFTVDNDLFAITAFVQNLMTNPSVSATVKGVIDIEKLSKAYPMGVDSDISGLLNVDFKTKFKKSDIINNRYKNIESDGTASLKNFTYKGAFKEPLKIESANLQFNPNVFSLTEFKATIGASDINVTGTLKNVYAYLFGKRELKGNLTVFANYIVVDDFLSEENKNTGDKNDTTVTKNTAEGVKIPKNIHIIAQLNAVKVKYNNIDLNNLKGTVTIQNQQVKFKNINGQMLGGTLSFNGLVQTQQSPASFDFDINLDKLDIKSSFNSLETFSSVAPIANAMQGNFSTKLKFKACYCDRVRIYRDLSIRII